MADQDKPGVMDMIRFGVPTVTLDRDAEVWHFEVELTFAVDHGALDRIREMMREDARAAARADDVVVPT